MQEKKNWLGHNPLPFPREIKFCKNAIRKAALWRQGLDYLGIKKQRVHAKVQHHVSRQNWLMIFGVHSKCSPCFFFNVSFLLAHSRPLGSLVEQNNQGDKHVFYVRSIFPYTAYSNQLVDNFPVQLQTSLVCIAETAQLCKSFLCLLPPLANLVHALSIVTFERNRWRSDLPCCYVTKCGRSIVLHSILVPVLIFAFCCT